MRYRLILLIFLLPFFAQAQLAEVDSLQNLLKNTNKPEPRTDILNKLSAAYSRISLAKAEQYARKALDFSTPIKYNRGTADAYNNLGVCASIKGMYSEGLEYFLTALKLRESEGDRKAVAKTFNNISGVYLYQGDYQKAISYSEKSLEILRAEEDQSGIGNAEVSLAMIYTAQKDTSSALSYYFQALDAFSAGGNKKREVQTLIKIGLLEKDKEKAKILETCKKALAEIKPENDFFLAVDLNQSIAQIYADMGKRPLAFKHYHAALALADKYFDNQAQIDIRKAMSELFAKDDHYDSALLYYQAFADLNEKTYSAEKSSQLVILEKGYESEKKDQQLESNKEEIQSLGLVIGAISIMLFLLVISGFVLYRFYRQKRQANEQLQQLIAAITSQARELQVANSEINRINEHLEEEVNSRTRKIQIQNEKLIDYVHFNSHEVRAPVARILGLADLMQKSSSPEETSDITNRILRSVQELDQIIRELNKKLETE